MADSETAEFTLSVGNPDGLTIDIRATITDPQAQDAEQVADDLIAVLMEFADSQVLED